jgi:hypothetical protein
MKKLTSLLAGGALFALASTAFAGQPLQLSDRQMDGVTAGAAAGALAWSAAIGDVTADTISQTSTDLSTITPKYAVGQAASQALAAGLVFEAAAASHAETAASLP